MTWSIKNTGASPSENQHPLLILCYSGVLVLSYLKYIHVDKRLPPHKQYTYFVC